MGFQGFENFGAQFAPLADAQLKQAYNDYQAQKDQGAFQHQLQADKMAAQKAAKETGYDSPLVDKVALSPRDLKALGYQEPAQGEDPEAHMAAYYELLDKQYPGSIDPNTRKAHPSLKAEVDAFLKSQKSLEMKANELAMKNKASADIEALKHKNAMERLKFSAGSRPSANKPSPYIQSLAKSIDIQEKALTGPNAMFLNDEQKAAIAADIQAKRLELQGAAPAQTAAPVQQAAPKKQEALANDGYKAWLAEHNAPDTKTNRDFYLNATKGK